MNLDYSVLLTIVGGMTALVSIITQVLKKVTWDKIPTNIVVLILSEVLSILGVFVYAEYTAISVTWIMIVGAVIGGFIVAYASMFGYDKLMETLGKLHK